MVHSVPAKARAAGVPSAGGTNSTEFNRSDISPVFGLDFEALVMIVPVS